MKTLRKNHDRSEFLELAATRLSFDGAKVQGRQLIADEGYVLEQSPDDKNAVVLRRNDGPFDPDAMVRCVCGLEGGSCSIMIISGDRDRAVCLPNEECGSSGLFCFMELAFRGGLKMNIMM
jgi:hypothetical protein